MSTGINYEGWYEMKRTPERFSQARHKVRGVISQTLRDIGNETLIIHSEPMDPAHLYRLLIPDVHYDIMLQASSLMPQRSYYVIDNLKLKTYTQPGMIPELIEYAINYVGAGERNGWLWPTYLNSIVPDTELGDKLLPLVDIAIQWETTLRLFHMMFSDIDSIPLIVHMLPWLRLVIPHIDKTHLTIQEKDILSKMFNATEPRHVPGVSKWFGQVCKYGTELVSFYNMTRRNITQGVDSLHPNGPSKVIIVPVLNENLTEDGLLDHFHEFVKGAQLSSPAQKAAHYKGFTS
jgi:hypothetical protein